MFEDTGCDVCVAIQRIIRAQIFIRQQTIFRDVSDDATVCEESEEYHQSQNLTMLERFAKNTKFQNTSIFLTYNPQCFRGKANYLKIKPHSPIVLRI